MKKLFQKISATGRCLMLSVLLVAGCISGSSAVSTSSKGTDFWLMFDGNLGTPALTLFITSSVNTSGTVSGASFSTISFTVAANTVTAVTMPATLATHASDVVDNKGIHVTALNDVTVYGLNYIQATTDAYLGLPTDVLGTDYYVMTYRNSNIVNGNTLGIVGTVNSTTVTITPSSTVGARTAGVPYNITLNQGETYELIQTGGTADLSSTKITSTQPIGVMGASQCANIPGGVTYCDHINEMIPPTNTWGKKFGTVPLKSRINGDTWRFMASTNGTTVSINGVAQVPVLNAGQFIERILTAASIVDADKPILATQFSNGSSFSGEPGDPFMMLIPPLEQFLGDYTVTNVSGYTAQFINIIAPNAIVGSVVLDAANIPAASFTPIGASGYSSAQITVTTGSHHLSASQPFGLFVYGFNTDDSYGYPGGQSFAPIAFANSIVLTPTTGSDLINNSHCWDAVVKDQNNSPLAGIVVHFDVLGANPGSTGFATTNSSGIAHFCYAGANAGLDSIISSVGTLRDTSNFLWTNCTVSIANCPQNISVNTGTNNTACSQVATWTPPTDASNCPNVTVTSNHQPGDVFQVGTTVVTYTFTDAHGSTNCSFNVTVVDNTPPVITCPPTATVSCDGSALPAATGTATATDNCGLTVAGVTFSDVSTQTPGQTSCGHYTYTITRTWSATDIHNNTSTCTQTINVQDNTGPVINCPNTVVLSCSADHSVAATGMATATDNCSGIASIVNYDFTVPGSCAGNYLILRIWIATDNCGNLTSCTQNIVILDTTPPVITCPANTTIACSASTAPANTGMATAIDACTGARLIFADVMTAGNCPGNYSIARTWTAIDSCGNSASCTQIITVRDIVGPVINCPASVTVPCTASTAPTAAGTGAATAQDGCSGVTSLISNDVTTPGTCANNYSIARTWTATDGCGNTSNCTQTITVRDQTAPVITCPASMTIPCTASTLPANTGTATAVDNCSTATISSTDVTTPGNCPGNYTIARTWKAVDACGNQSMCVQTITVRDQIAPVINCPGNVTLSCTASTLPANTGTATATEGCGTATVTYIDGTVAGNCPNNRVITRTWKATDACGNFSTCTQIITIQDQTAPVITCPASTTVSCSADRTPAGTGTATATDNCGNATVSYTDVTTAGSCANNYSIARTWKATDACGNSSTCVQTITVRDNSAPVLTCPANVSACDNLTGNSMTLTLVATDNCSTPTVTYTITGVTSGSGTGKVVTKNFNVGTSTIAWTATDACGNTSNCSTTVLIKAVPVASISASDANSFCNSLDLTGNSTVSGSAYAWTYNNAAFASTQTIRLHVNNSDGIYTLKVTGPAGCISSPVTYNFQKQSLINMYVLLGFKEVDLNDNNDVYNGSVGVTSSYGDADFDHYCSVASTGAFVKADDINTESNVNIPTKIYSAAVVTLPTLLLNTSSTSSLSNYTKTSSGTVTGNYRDLTINSGKTVTVTGNIFRNIKINSGCTITFTASDISLASLDIDDNCTINFSGNTVFRVTDRIDVDKNCSVNPAGKKVTFYIKDPSTSSNNCYNNYHYWRNGNNGDEVFIVEGQQTSVIANVYIPDGKIRIHGNGYSCNWNSNESCSMTGLFIAEEIESDGKNVNWYSYDCASHGMRQTAAAAQINEVTENTVLVYPNPTSGVFTVQFPQMNEAATVQITDISGRLVDQRIVPQQTSLSTTFDLSDKSAGVYLIQVQQGGMIYRSKLVVK